MLPLLGDFESVVEIPHTISYFIRKIRQIASFDELPKAKRPPEAIWDNSKALDEWFDRVFEYNKQSDGSPTETRIFIADSEIEG